MTLSKGNFSGYSNPDLSSSRIIEIEQTALVSAGALKGSMKWLLRVPVTTHAVEKSKSV